jgi:hypothetical protein
MREGRETGLSSHCICKGEKARPIGRAEAFEDEVIPTAGQCFLRRGKKSGGSKWFLLQFLDWH